MLKVGITGGIGTGKTTICQIFELLGIPVFYADAVGKQLMVDDPKVIESIKVLFGQEAYFNDTTLNKKHIANIVFKNQDKLTQLNNIIHPAVKDSFTKWCLKQTAPYVLKEAAIMFESKSHLDNDFNILVSSPIETRIERVIKRDLATRESVLDRISKQMPEKEKEKLCDFIIVNDDKTFLIEQVLALHKKFTSKH